MLRRRSSCSKTRVCSPVRRRITASGGSTEPSAKRASTSPTIRRASSSSSCAWTIAGAGPEGAIETSVLPWRRVLQAMSVFAAWMISGVER